MTDVPDLERAIGPWLGDVAAPRVPDYFDDMIAATIRRRQRPAWLAGGVGAVLPGRVARLEQPLVRLAIIAALLAALAVGAAVGGGLLNRTVAPTPVERIERLLSLPWQATPMEPTAEIARVVDEECLGAAALGERRLRRAVLDYRGGDQLYAVYADDEGWVFCGIAAGPDGQLGAWFSPMTPADNPRPTTLTNFGVEDVRDLGGPLSNATEHGVGLFAGGRVAPPIARVDIVFATGLRLRASVGGGFYGAWWPGGPMEAFTAEGGRPIGPLEQPTYEGFDASGRLITDRYGYLLSDP